MLDRLTSADFQPYLGQVFRLDPGGGGEPLALELIEVNPLGPAPVVGGRALRAPFALVFRGPRQIVLPQRIYRLEHEALGALDIFIVPIGPDAQGMCYEAVFG